MRTQTNVHARTRGAQKEREREAHRAPRALYSFLSAARVGVQLPFLAYSPCGSGRKVASARCVRARVFTREERLGCALAGRGIPPPCSIIATELSVTSGCNRITAACNNNVTRVIMGAPRFGSTSQSSGRWAAVRACLVHLLCATRFIHSRWNSGKQCGRHRDCLDFFSCHGAARTKSARPSDKKPRDRTFGAFHSNRDSNMRDNIPRTTRKFNFCPGIELDEIRFGDSAVNIDFPRA
jgi:hypothetical protein